jgi:hypothetical protein
VPSPESNDRDNRRQKPGSRNLDQKFSDRHPGLVGIVFVEDDTSFKGRLRKHLRNPPMRTVFLIVVLVFVIPVAIAYSKVSNVAQEKWRDVQQARDRHFVKVTAASWIYPFLKRQAIRMQETDVPAEWLSVRFTNGACLPEHMAQLPGGKYAYAIESACGLLDEIQVKYALDCAQTSACNIPGEAVIELQIVLDRLKIAFSDANLVQPVTDDQGQIRD